MSEHIVVAEHAVELAFSYEDMLRYHGGGSPAGVANAYKVLERALPLLEAGRPVERRELLIDTAFGGPGARDGFELVTRAVTGERYVVDPELARPANGPTRERFVFRLRYRDQTVTLSLREGFVTDEFSDLTGREHRSAGDERRLIVMKTELAAHVLSKDATDVYEVD